MILTGTGIVASSIQTFILDDYSGAVAAYSLRLLSSTFSGNAIRIRRASDNAEVNIGFISNSLDEATINSFCSGTNCFVTTWYDQSGNGYNASNATALSQPKIYDSVTGLIELDSKPSVFFDGAQSLDANSVAASFSGTDKYLSSALVYNATEETPAASRAWFGFGRSTTTTELRWFGQNNAVSYQMRLDNRDSSSVLSNLSGGDCQNQVLGFVISNMDNNQFWQNSTSIASDTKSMGNTTLDRFSLGCLTRSSKSVFAKGNFQELIIYASNQTSNREGISTNIYNYYGI